MNHPNTLVANKILLIVSFFIIILFAWTGYLASDNMMYTSAAQGWLSDPGYLGKNHWSLRTPAVIPIVISFGIFGVNEYSLALTSTFYFALLCILFYWITDRVYDARAALISTLVLITTPLLALESTIAGCDLAEVFFIFTSLTLAYLGTRKSAPLYMIAAGISAGLAWMTRETSTALLLFYGLQFLLGRKEHRKLLFILLASAATVILVEIFYFYIRTGDFIYRLMIDIDQGRSDPTHMIAKAHGTGNIEISPLLNPFLTIFANQEFMFLFYMAIPASIYFLRDGSGKHTFARHLVWMMILWFVVISYLLPVRELPRYYMVSATSAAIITGLWLYQLSRKYRTIAYILLIGLVTSSLFGIYIDNKQPLEGEHRLTQWIMSHQDQDIYTDPVTFSKSKLLLEAAGTRDRVHAGLPPAGELYFYNPNRVYESTREPGYSQRYSVPKSWELLETFPAYERPVIRCMLDITGIASRLPESIYRKLVKPNRDTSIYHH